PADHPAPDHRPDRPRQVQRAAAARRALGRHHRTHPFPHRAGAGPAHPAVAARRPGAAAAAGRARRRPPATGLEHLAARPHQPATRERLRIPLFGYGRPIMALNLRALIARLNTTVRGAMEGAAGLCMSRGHYEVEVEHVLAKLMEVENSDIRRILRQFEIAPEALERELGKALDGFKAGNQRTPALSA